MKIKNNYGKSTLIPQDLFRTCSSMCVKDIWTKLLHCIIDNLEFTALVLIKKNKMLQLVVFGVGGVGSVEVVVTNLHLQCRKIDNSSRLLSIIF